VNLMIIGDRLRAIRESKNLSQGDIQERTGLLRCYISRVENGHTIPSVATLEKMARAMEMQLYQVLYEGDQPPRPLIGLAQDEPGSWGKSARYFRKLTDCLSRMDQADRLTILELVKELAKRRQQRKV
jgi:transcriptional regulator with XRE-family HTH domain